MKDFRADLHCHSTCSDGFLSPLELVQLAKKVGLSGLSITDHDTIEAYATAIPLCAELGISLLTGVEFSTVLESTSVHILGYGFDPQNQEVLAFCERHAERRKARNRTILELLKKNGMPLTEDDLIAAMPACMKNKRCTIGRPHIALAMVNKGYVGSLQEAFRRFIGEDKPCYSQGVAFSVRETINLIHHTHGIAVIAHPHLLPNRHVLEALLELPFDGIECYYGNFQADDHKKWLQIAQQKNWLITGGSDFHGPIKPNLDLGCSWINEEAFQAITQRLNISS